LPAFSSERTVLGARFGTIHSPYSIFAMSTSLIHSFIRQVLGFEVDAINSVQFSNHTGYSHFKGQRLAADELLDLYSGLKLNNLCAKYTHVLTGYMGSSQFLNQVYAIIKEMKQENKHLIYVCDPVMGDRGKMYVSPDLLPIYRDKLTQLADVVTPNQFEAELLTGIKIVNEDDAIKAMDILHSRGVPIVIISSSDLGDEETLIALGSMKRGRKTERYRIKIPLFPTSFVGTGDLFAALLLAWLTKTDFNLSLSLENTIATLQDVLKSTYNYASNAKGGFTSENLELKLIQNVSSILKPQTFIESERVECEN
ncbi:pyridoxal kinase-like protein, partial [Dinothrombium tinctorium]